MKFHKSLLLLLMLFSISTNLISDDKEEAAVREYVKQLGDTNFTIREKATKELTKISFKFAKILTEELKNSTDLEIQERLKEILDQSEEKLNEIFGEKILAAQQLLSEKKFDQALLEVNSILDVRQEYSRAVELKIQILEVKADYKECIQLIKKRLDVVKSDSNEHEELGMILSRVLLKAGEYADAVKLLEKMLVQSRWPDNIQYYLYNAYELNKQFDKAEEMHLKEANKMNNLQYSTTIAWFYIRIGKPDKAKPFLEKFFIQSNKFSVTDVLNYIFLEQLEKGAETTRLNTEPILSALKGKTNISSSDLESNDIFYLCYQYYFEKMSKQKSEIEFKNLYNLFSDEDKKVWPIPLLGLYGGELTVEKMESLIQNTDKYKMRMDKCEAYFYLGLLRVCENKNQDAKKYFQLSKEQQVYDYIETTGDSYFLQKIK